jgi:hypothetical protein
LAASAKAPLAMATASALRVGAVEGGEASIAQDQVGRSHV